MKIKITILLSGLLAAAAFSGCTAEGDMPSAQPLTAIRAVNTGLSGVSSRSQVGGIADDGSLAATCDSFKLATSYVIDAPESAELSITGNVGYLASLANVDQAKIAECLQAHAGAKCPYAKAASWDGEIFIDANAERISSTFTLDDPNGTIVTVIIDGKTGRISAM